MDLSQFKPGQRLTKGVVYRRIPNRDTHYDYDEDMPDIGAFVPRAQDDGVLSADIDYDSVRDSLTQSKHKGYGLVALDIEAMSSETGGGVTVRFGYKGERRGSHVEIHGVSNEEVRLILCSLAEVDQRPDPPSGKK